MGAAIEDSQINRKHGYNRYRERAPQERITQFQLISEFEFTPFVHDKICHISTSLAQPGLLSWGQKGRESEALRAPTPIDCLKV